MKQACLKFPHFHLPTRAAHHLRGYFGNLFREHSPLLHNHYADGSLRYRYPLVQYKVVDGVPMLVGLGEGAQLLVDLFLQFEELEIDGQAYPLHHKHIQCRELEMGYSEALHRYEFKTLWMALNQRNYREYRAESEEQRRAHLMRILRGNILSAFKGLGIWLAPDQKILCQPVVRERQTQFKNQPMLAFTGHFTTNALLPPWIGLGKAVSRGFGVIRPVNGN